MCLRRKFLRLCYRRKMKQPTTSSAWTPDMHAVLVSNHCARCYVSPKLAADIRKDKSCLPARPYSSHRTTASESLTRSMDQRPFKLEHVYPSRVTKMYICLEILSSSLWISLMFVDISESKLSCHLLRVQPLQTVRHGILRTNSLAQNPESHHLDKIMCSY